MREVLPYKSGQGVHLIRGLVSAHKADTGNSGGIFVYEKREKMCIQRHTFILPEPRAVTAAAPVGTTRDIERKGYLVRNFLTDNIKIITLDHCGMLYLYLGPLFLSHLLGLCGLFQLLHVSHSQGGSYLSVIRCIVAAGRLFLPWS